jgi:hypothetical protein
MKKITFLFGMLFLLAFQIYSQNPNKIKAEKYLSVKGELTFTFKVKNKAEIETFTKNLSIVNYNPKTNKVLAWANEKQFRDFESLNIPFEIPVSENEVDEAFIYDNKVTAKNTNKTNKFAANTLSFPVSTYPTYAQYAQQMQDFENSFPALVKKISLGNTTENDGKELLFVKISDNVNTDEQEPKLMLTSSMHGDEIAGYPMMLSLIDYILTVYADTGHSDHARIKNLVENSEIWINPSANPDGTYYGSPGNTSVTGSRRGNYNNIDLNRNYPDNVAGPHDDGNAYQTETLAFMALADTEHFVISANFHGGTELVNYPFDNAYVSQYTHPDGNWFEFTGVEYATHAQNDSNTLGDMTYMTADDDSNIYPSPGVTHGAEWYRVYGGRQDYMNYYKQCKEITIELSDTKILPASQLVNYWLFISNISTNNNSYKLPNVLKDGSIASNPLNITFLTSGYNGTPGIPGVTPIGIADYWIWKYSNQLSNSYPSWQHVRSTGTILAGEGFTMKGVENTSGVISLEQNYVFNGKPNNGDINLTLSAGNDYLIGNPYASAIDANEFILDNINSSGGRASTNIIDGSLYFWEHFASSTHVLAEYQGGYGTYNLIEGVKAISNDSRIDATGELGTKTPQRYIPVSQGFFVTANTGGNVSFKNSQRVFKTEANDPSVFMKPSNIKEDKKITASDIDTREKIKLIFDSPYHYHRQLLVGVDSNASNDLDLGYDAILIENNKEDMFWIVNDKNLVIQGVNNFSPEQKLPLGVKIYQQGLGTIKLDVLENIPDNLNIYIHDSQLDIIHNLKESNYEVYLTPGTITDRFEILFDITPEISLGIDDTEIKALQMFYSNEDSSLILHNPELKQIKSAQLLNMLGQVVYNFKNIETINYQKFKTKPIAEGTYILKLQTNDYETSKKVLIN